MKRIMNPRTVRATLNKVDKRLTEIEDERLTLTQLRASLEAQLPMPLAGTEQPDPDWLLGNIVRGTPKTWIKLTEACVDKNGPVLDPDVAPRAEAVSNTPPETLEDVDGCYWANGPHQHRMTEIGWTCLAPAEQWKQPSGKPDKTGTQERVITSPPYESSLQGEAPS